jgi:hypothetical protein
MTKVGANPEFVKSDGADLWVADFSSSDVKRVRASDGRLLETWTGATIATGVLVTQGRVYVAGGTSPGRIYVINPTLPPGAVATLSSSLGNIPFGLATDGVFIWTTTASGSISKVDPVSGVPTNIPGVGAALVDILFDGANLWVTDAGGNALKKLDSNGGVLQTVPVGPEPAHPGFDGSNIWVPTNNNSVTVVRVSDGQVLATLTGNGLNGPNQVAFDGELILVTNLSGDSVSLWKATDLTPIGTFSTGANTGPWGACSDGINFWITLLNTNQLARF